MAVLNTTPDSFSDGGRYSAIDVALAQAETLIGQGAHIIDVGGESTRPGATRVDPDVELSRVITVVSELAAAGVCVSVDTFNASTARATLNAGAQIINDVSGGLADPEMFTTVADSEAHYVLGHWRGHADVMNANAVYRDVADEVGTELAAQRDLALGAGLVADRIVLDPGLGFAKNSEQNWSVLGHLDRILGLGHRVLVGASRKRFIADLLPADRAGDMHARDLPTAVVHALAVQAGAWGVRAHSVPETVTALGAVAAWQSGSRG